MLAANLYREEAAGEVAEENFQIPNTALTIVIIDGNVPTTTFVDALINAMAEAGYDVVVIGKKKGVPRYHKNVRVVIVPVGKIAQCMFVARNLIAARFKHFALLNRNKKSMRSLFSDLLFYLPIIAAKPDRVHFQWATFLHEKELLFDIFPGKIMVSLRGAHINYKPITHPEIRGTFEQHFPKVQKFHAVSNAIAKEAQKYNASADRIKTVYSYVNDGCVNKEIAPKEGGVLKLISIGRFHWKKGYDYALDALALVKSKNIPFEYTIVAQGNIPDSIIFQIDQLGLKERVKIVNGLPHVEVLNAIERSDALLLPSTEEGIANVVLEAMAVGTPVITTDCGGMEEVIDHTVSGLVVGIRDVNAMAEAICTFNQMSSGDRFNMAMKAKMRIKEYHSRAAFVKGFQEFYN